MNLSFSKFTEIETSFRLEGSLRIAGPINNKRRSEVERERKGFGRPVFDRLLHHCRVTSRVNPSPLSSHARILRGVYPDLKV